MSQLVLAKIGRVPSSHDDPVEFDLFTARVSYFISRNFSLASRQTRYNPLYHHRRRDKRSYIIFSFQPFTTSIMILAWIVWTRIWFFYFFFPSENVNDVRRFMRQPHVARLLLFLLLLFLFSFFFFLFVISCVCALFSRFFQDSARNTSRKEDRNPLLREDARGNNCNNNNRCCGRCCWVVDNIRISERYNAP